MRVWPVLLFIVVTAGFFKLIWPVESCLRVGEPPGAGDLLFRSMSHTDLPSRWWPAFDRSQQAFPDQLIGAAQQPLSTTELSIWKGAVDWQIDLQDEGDRWRDRASLNTELRTLAETLFRRDPAIGSVSLNVFRGTLWVYGARIPHTRTGVHPVYVRKDWGCSR